MNTSRDIKDQDHFKNVISSFFKLLQSARPDSQVDLIAKHYLLYLEAIIKKVDFDSTFLMNAIRSFERKHNTPLDARLLEDIESQGEQLNLLSEKARRNIYLSHVNWNETPIKAAPCPIVFRSGLTGNDLSDSQLLHYTAKTDEENILKKMILLDHNIQVATLLSKVSHVGGNEITKLTDSIFLLREIFISDFYRKEILQNQHLLKNKVQLEQLAKKIMILIFSCIDTSIPEGSEYDKAMDAAILLLDLLQAEPLTTFTPLEFINFYIRLSESSLSCGEYDKANLLAQKSELLLQYSANQDTKAFNQMRVVLQNLQMYIFHDSAKRYYQNGDYNTALLHIEKALYYNEAMCKIYRAHSHEPISDTILQQLNTLIESLYYLNKVLALQNWRDNAFKEAKEHFKEAKKSVDKLSVLPPGAMKDFKVFSALFKVHSLVNALSQKQHAIGQHELQTISEAIYQLINYCFNKLCKNIETDLRSDEFMQCLKVNVIDALLKYSARYLEAKHFKKLKYFLNLASMLMDSLQDDNQDKRMLIKQLAQAGVDMLFMNIQKTIHKHSSKNVDALLKTAQELLNLYIGSEDEARNKKMSDLKDKHVKRKYTLTLFVRDKKTRKSRKFRENSSPRSSNQYP